MSYYRNQIDDTDLGIFKSGSFFIECDDQGKTNPTFNPRPEDRYAIALDILGEVENPNDNWHTPEFVADLENKTEADLLYFAFRNLKALAIRRERASKAVAEAKEAEDRLDAEAEALFKAAFPGGSWHAAMYGTKNTYRAVASAARELYAGGTK